MFVYPTTTTVSPIVILALCFALCIGPDEVDDRSVGHSEVGFEAIDARPSITIRS